MWNQCMLRNMSGFYVLKSASCFPDQHKMQIQRRTITGGYPQNWGWIRYLGEMWTGAEWIRKSHSKTVRNSLKQEGKFFFPLRITLFPYILSVGIIYNVCVCVCGGVCACTHMCKHRYVGVFVFVVGYLFDVVYVHMHVCVYDACMFAYICLYLQIHAYIYLEVGCI